MKNMFSVGKRMKLNYSVVFSRLKLHRSCRVISTIAKDTTLELDPQFEDFKNGHKNGKGFSYRKHPGIVNVKRVVTPVTLETAINKLMNVFEVKDVDKLSKKLGNYLWSRHLPVEQLNLKMKAMRLEAEEINKIPNFDEIPQAEQYMLLNQKKDKVLHKLKKSTYHWQTLRFDAHNSVVYMAARMVQEYSVLVRIFSEISKRERDFSPQTFFDFGSGTGSAMWAANLTWPKSLNEHYCVDVSSDMNTLSQLLLQGGKNQGEMCFKGVSYRQFLPGSHKNKFSLVVSAYSLFELSSSQERYKVIESLWKKTDDFLVIVEHGTNAGFKVIMEAREAIRKMSGLEKSGVDCLSRSDKFEEVKLTGHVFAPCPHEEACPRNGDKMPCNFDVGYKPLEYFVKEGKKLERFSYVVFRKGEEKSATSSWPRVIRPISTPARHVHCRLCCSNGKLEHHILTAKKNGKDLYKCARACSWGDLIPGNLVPAKDKASSKISEGVEDVTEHQDVQLDKDTSTAAESPNVLTHNDSWSSIVNHTYREEKLEEFDSEEIGTFKPVS